MTCGTPAGKGSCAADEAYDKSTKKSSRHDTFEPVSVTKSGDTCTCKYQITVDPAWVGPDAVTNYALLCAYNFGGGTGVSKLTQDLLPVVSEGWGGAGGAASAPPGNGSAVALAAAAMALVVAAACAASAPDPDPDPHLRQRQKSCHAGT